MKSVKTSITNFDSNIDAITYDILCTQQVQYSDVVVGCSFVNLELNDKDNLYAKMVKFEWLADKYKMDDDDFCGTNMHIIFLLYIKKIISSLFMTNFMQNLSGLMETKLIMSQ
jgi:hypothetical protein